MEIKDFRYILHQVGGQTVSFLPCRVDDTSDPKYYGFASVSGSWMIMRQTESIGAFQYCFGKRDFLTHWGNRAGLTYRELWEAIEPDNVVK